jgi:quinate dehydrogenase
MGANRHITRAPYISETTRQSMTDLWRDDFSHEPRSRSESEIRKSIVVKPSNERRTVYLFGQPIAHSVSPLFHQTIFNELELPWRYIRLDSEDPEDLLWLLYRDDFVGAAITMPNKVKLLHHVDVLTPIAQRIGCINTIFLQEKSVEGQRHRTYIGDNTDWAGIQKSLLCRQSDLAEHLRTHSAMVIGGGATCRSAIYALTEGLGAKVVYLANRDRAELESIIHDLEERGLSRDFRCIETVDQAEAVVNPPAVIVSAVPDLQPQTESETVLRRIVTAILRLESESSRSSDHKSKGIFLEMCYDPTPWTQLAKLAYNAQWEFVTGLDVMSHQAIEQDVLWTGRQINDLPFEAAKLAICKSLAKKH